MANGVNFTKEARDIIAEVGSLLEYCGGWPNKEKYEVYAAKEKLGRINNNLGGLGNVDQQMAQLFGGGNNNEVEKYSLPGLLIMVIAIPMAAVLVIGIAIGLTVYYVREKKNAVVEQAAFESEDEPSDDTPLKTSVMHVQEVQNAQEVPISGTKESVVLLDQDKPPQGGDDTSEEQQ